MPGRDLYSRIEELVASSMSGCQGSIRTTIRITIRGIMGESSRFPTWMR